MSIGHPSLDARHPAVGLWSAALGMALPMLCVAWTISPAGMMLSAVVFAAGLGVTVTAFRRSRPDRRFGAANVVTTLRLALTAAIASALATSAEPDGWTAWSVAGLAFVALCLDGLDGWLARRQGLCSSFGARYDMEVDAVLAAVLSLVLLTRGTAGAELLVLGGARYAFVASGRVLPWLTAALPDSLRRKIVCVIQIGTLVALTVPVFPEAATRPVALVAAALVVWSFAIDTLWLVRTR